ncbi:glucan biosynthesis protein G [Caulobacter sp. Root655]|uniref:glucan biosynthesis protein G n=1 Tax=Caulobacter sp. Root655 TaxID=1736578 RepID=UPI0006F27889|nr:glucan biosynthesis protein G [Caulobacter sp. Root655]KRA63863.1 glucan biosynthesis protein G [Caulobacter sp. Root655]
MFSSFVNRRAALGKLSLSAVLALAPRLAAAQTAPAGVENVMSEPFSVEILQDRARALAAAPYSPPPAAPSLSGLTYDEYFRIRFRSDHALWKDRTPSFRAEFFPPAYLYPRPLPLYEVAAGLARPIAFDPGMFDFPGEHADVAKAWSGFSGFRLLWPLNEADKLDEVAVFQGASYFRSLGRGQRYGLSARGLAIGAGEPNEEFPDFTSFWLERPQNNSGAIDGDAVVVHALMNSPSCAGAYSFTIRPGEDVVFDVAAAVFPRATIAKAGVAAMSSMFLFNVADSPPVDDFRTAVHDSDGLAIWTGQGEHLWRPLQNPKAHRLSNFPDENPKGFGLVQRARNLEDFGDLQARYDLRPSLWVEPLDAWGKGAVHLAELATTKETDDNIAIFWRPEAPWTAGSRVDLRYRLHWGQERFASPDARVFRTRTGADNQAGLRLFTVDLQGGALAEGLDGVALEVKADGGTVVWSDLSPYPGEASARAAFGLKPTASQAELSLRLVRGGQAISETWRYLWTA